MTTHHIDRVNGSDANDGSDWANAWLTIASGATAARIAPGDLIKIAKTPDPVSIGTCQWNDLSKTVTRTGSPPAGSETLLIDDCESGWTADNSSTVTHPTTVMKSGSASVNVTKASYATATRYAHKTLAAPLDLSGFEAITGWLNNDAAIADAARWVICLCSDNDGLVIVDSFAVQAIPSTNRRVAFRYERVGGGALGASIASIAIYSGASAPTNGQDLGLDNVNACNDFSILSLITKASTAGYDAEGVYPIQSINGTTILIDNDTNTLASAGRGYSGTTEEVTTYRREALKTALVVTGDVQSIQEGGTNGSPITFSGGWNTSSGLQDGMSLFDGQNGAATGLGVAVASPWLVIERLAFVRYLQALNFGAGTDRVQFASCMVAGCTASATQFSGSGFDFTDCWFGNGGGSGISCPIESTLVRVRANNNATGISQSRRTKLVDCVAKNNSGSGISNTSQLTARGLALADNGSQVAVSSGSEPVLANVTLGANPFTFTAYSNGRVYLPNYLGDGCDWQITDGGACFQSSTDFDAPATGKMWTLLTDTDGRRTSSYPLRLRLPGVAVVANKIVTISARMRKAHATNVNGRFVLPGGQIAGVDADVVATLADSTDEQTLTLTFTPTAAGVVVPEVWAEYVAGHAAVCIDRITVAQVA